MENVIYMDELKYVPYHKTGFKILRKSQLENMFPSYEMILERIENHRKSLEKMGRGYEKFDSQFNLMYDNVFSILGKRGSGKTSAVFTIKSLLQSKKKYDLILPIVMPEVIPRECSMIGWVLSLLEQTVEELENKMKELAGNGTGFEDCMCSPRKGLRSEYNNIKELCYSQFYNVDSTESLWNVIVNTEKKTQNSFDFSKSLAKFWNSLKHALCKVHGLTKGEEPLIYIFFDDVDLLPDRVMDLFFTIIKYLSHPNLVVFVTADEELLYDVIENEMNERLGKYKEVSVYGLASVGSWPYRFDRPENMEARMKLRHKLQLMKEMPKLYGDKILPPSSRFYLETFDTSSKGTFIERYDEDGSGITLEKFMRSQIKDYLAENKLDVKKDNFLIYKSKFINTYFDFWGETSRQLANECLIVEDFFTRLKTIREKVVNRYDMKKSYLHELFYAIHYFVYNTLNAYGNLGMSSSELKNMVNKMVLYRPDSWGIYMDYQYLKERVQERLDSDEEGNVENIIKENMIFFILMFFVENILLLEAKCGNISDRYRRKSIHGQAELVEILDNITQGNASLVCRNAMNMNAFLYVYGYILERPEILINFKLLKPDEARRYFDALPDDAGDMQRPLEIHIRENPFWFETMVKTLFLINENIYSIRRKTLPYYNIVSQINRYDPFFVKMMMDFRAGFMKVAIHNALDEERGTAIDRLEGELRNVIIKQRQVGKKMDITSIIDAKSTFNLDKLEKSIKSFCKRSRIKYKEEFPFVYLLSKKAYSGIFYDFLDITEAMKAVEFTKTLERICEKLKEELVTLGLNFSYYRVTDEHKFLTALDQTNLKIDIVEDWGTGERKGLYVNTARMAVILKRLLQGRFEAEYENYSKMDSWEDESEDRKNQAFVQLTSSLEIALFGQEDQQKGIEFLALYGALSYVNRLYLRAYLIDASQNNTLVDRHHMPYKTLYNELISILRKNRADYITIMSRQYIEDGVTEYYDALMRNEEHG